MQSILDTKLHDHMSAPARSVKPSDLLEVVYQRLLAEQVSSFAVVDGQSFVGVVSRTDLLRASVAVKDSNSLSSNMGLRSMALEFKATPVEEIMTRSVELVSSDSTLAVASKIMCERSVHRVFVGEQGGLKGVFSTLDIMRSLRSSDAPQTIGDHMSVPVQTVDVEDSVAEATELLTRGKVSGLIAVENEWPVGVYTQVEALAARHVDPNTLVEDAMDPALICMPVSTKMYRAAQQALRMRVRRIVASETRHMRGVLSGLDFARYAAQLA